MPRLKKPRTEIVRVQPQMDLATLDALIQRRVAEAQADQGAILEPWFQTSKTLAAEIRRHESLFHKRKFTLYFEKWGCVICGTKRKSHESHGMCRGCRGRFVFRLRQLEREYAKSHPAEYQDQQVESLTSRIRSAERILGSKTQSET